VEGTPIFTPVFVPSSDVNVQRARRHIERKLRGRKATKRPPGSVPDSLKNVLKHPHVRPRAGLGPVQSRFYEESCFPPPRAPGLSRLTGNILDRRAFLNRMLQGISAAVVCRAPRQFSSRRQRTPQLNLVRTYVNGGKTSFIAPFHFAFFVEVDGDDARGDTRILCRHPQKQAPALIDFGRNARPALPRKE